MKLSVKLPRFLTILILSLLLASIPVNARIYYEDDLAIQYHMYVNDSYVGTIKSAARGLALADSLVEDLKAQYGRESIIDRSIIFKETRGNDKAFTDTSQIESAIRDVLTVKSNAYALLIEDKLVFYVEDQTIAEQALEQLKDDLVQSLNLKEDTQLEDIYFKEKINFEEEIIEVEKILSLDKAFLKLNSSLDADGDPFLLTIITKERMTLAENLDYETETRINDNLDYGKSRIVQAGEMGRKNSQYLIYRENGIELNREKISETIEKEPVKKIVEKGTRLSSRASNINYSGPVTGTDIVNVALKQLGKPYVHAGHSPSVGFDCSGLVWYVYKLHFGIDIKHRTAKGLATIGTPVSKGEWLPGDIILLTSSGSAKTNGVGHVGIYVGDYNGQKDAFIHARGSSRNPKKVEIGYLTTKNHQLRYKGARRIIE